MQSGTVADISAVVDNCAVALQEAEELAAVQMANVDAAVAAQAAAAGDAAE